jgi:hypothetical protein
MQDYHVRGERIGSSYAHASARGFVLRLRAIHADPPYGFEPIATWFAALDFVAELSGISLDETWIEFEASHQDKPPLLTQIRHVLHLASEAAKERLDRLVTLAEPNSMVSRPSLGRFPLKGIGR